VLVDADFRGKPRKMLMQASRNRLLLRAGSGQRGELLTTAFGPVNWATGLDKKGQPIPNPARTPLPMDA